MYMKQLKMQATEDFKDLKNVVNTHTGSFDELLTKLDGYNVQTPVLFDVNFGTIIATVTYLNGKFSVSNIVDICDKDSCEIVSKDVELED